ncbi:hypothetical protein, partial [uncultured Rikenella sp.]
GRSHPRRRPATRRSSFPASLAPARYNFYRFECIYRALTEILSKHAVRVWMISYSSGRARDEFGVRAGAIQLFRLIVETVESPL